jgi:hypothetical protein
VRFTANLRCPQFIVIDALDNVLREVREQIQPAPHVVALGAARRGDEQQFAKCGFVRQFADCL